MSAETPQDPGRDAELTGGLRHHGLQHAQGVGQGLVPGKRRRQVIEGKLGRPPERAVRSREPRLARGGGTDRRPDVLQRGIRERRADGLLNDPGDESPVRAEQHVPDVFGPRVGGVVQGEVQAVDLRARVEAVETALLPGEFIHDDDVPELARGPCAHLDGLAHTHLAQLNQPRPVPVAGEPGVRVPVEVAFQLLAPLVQRRGRREALNARGGVLADEEGGSLEPVKEPWPLAGRRLVQGPDDAFTVSLVLGQVQAGEVQAVVPGQDDLEDLSHHVRLGEVQRIQERPAHR